MSNWTWGEDGASIFATVDGVDRRIASLPLPHWVTNRGDAVELRKEIARKMAAADELIEALELAEFALAGKREDRDPTLEKIRAALKKAGIDAT